MCTFCVFFFGSGFVQKQTQKICCSVWNKTRTVKWWILNASKWLPSVRLPRTQVLYSEKNFICLLLSGLHGCKEYLLCFILLPGCQPTHWRYSVKFLRVSVCYLIYFIFEVLTSQVSIFSQQNFIFPPNYIYWWYFVIQEISVKSLLECYVL